MHLRAGLVVIEGVMHVRRRRQSLHGVQRARDQFARTFCGRLVEWGYTIAPGLFVTYRIGEVCEKCRRVEGVERKLRGPEYWERRGR